ncbi:uncharacterized protein LOC130296151 [Hyla sarda]|uniref:uncharacterized protein LOC130296151 n=1 Tax=Hyla sarda TaxID=327740 RepID=UPI0024C38667|nr:uncharacterized protein LOC130296151 [Hyla sarda]
MAESTDLVEIRGLKSSLGYFKANELLSINQIYPRSENRRLNYAGQKMKFSIEGVRSDLFLRLPVEFPVTRLRHTTTWTATEDILASQSFIGRQHDREEFMDLSFWGADIPSSDIEKAREDVYTYVHGNVPPEEAEEYRGEITRQFANSPAFDKEASRYGNFTFSLPFSDLLSLYKSQFCNKEEPQLSILGTDLYKQEIVHYVVVHCPDEARFMDLPRVRILQTREEEEPLPCVYWMGETLYWRPESTSADLKVLCKEGHIIAGHCEPHCGWFTDRGHCCHGVACVWNHLVFAFHIPDGRELEIPGQKLIDNLSACNALKPFMKDEKLEKPEAENIIRDMKKRYGGADD